MTPDQIDGTSAVDLDWYLAIDDTHARVQAERQRREAGRG